MKKFLTPLLAAGALSVGISSASAQTLFITGNTTTIKRSDDGGQTFSTFGATGTNLRGIDVNPANGTVYVSDTGAGVDAATRPIYSLAGDGTRVDTTTYNNNGSFNGNPLGFYNGYTYVSSGSAGGSNQQQFGYTATTGTNQATFTSKPLASANAGGWQANDITFASTGGTNYAFYNGAGGNAVNRSEITATGAFVSRIGVATPAGVDKTGFGASSAAAGAGSGTGTGTTATTLAPNFNDLGFTSSGRLLTMGQGAGVSPAVQQNGFFLSAPGQITSNSITLDRVFAFTLTENAANGDMGNVAQDFKLLGNDLFAVTNTRLYRYLVNDTAGTISFVSSTLHGFNNGGVQIAGAVPEPTAALMLMSGTGMLLGFRRGRR
jgi:hypothetical protein